jgi:hypothetical protein
MSRVVGVAANPPAARTPAVARLGPPSGRRQATMTPKMQNRLPATRVTGSVRWVTDTSDRSPPGAIIRDQSRNSRQDGTSNARASRAT